MRNIIIIFLILTVALFSGCVQKTPIFEEEEAVRSETGQNEREEEVCNETDPSVNDKTSDVPDPLQFEVGTVTIVSNGREHEPYVHFIAGFDGEMFADGIDISIEEVAAALPEIQYADDFQIVINGIYAEKAFCSLYNDKLELINEWSAFDPVFSIPVESGTHILSIGVGWNNGVNEGANMRYVFLKYYFKIVL